MKLTILGSGTTDPTNRRNESGYLLEIGKDLILIDAGSGTKEHIADSRHDDLRISHILISHTHVDHVADLPALFWSWWVRQRTEIVTILGPKKITGFVKKLSEAFFPKFKDYFTYNIKAKAMHNSVYRTKNWQVKSVFTSKQGHTYTPYALAYRIERHNKSFVYSGDINYDYPESIVKISKDADALVIDCGNPDSQKHKGHLTPNKIAEIASKAKVKKLVLTHFYRPIGEYSFKEAKTIFKGPIVLAKDLMKINV